MKTPLIALITLITIQFSFSQEITFDWMHRFTNGLNCQSRCMEMGPDGYLYLGADFEGTLQFLDTTVTATGSSNALLAKLTSDGDFV
ncbi:MAG: hypothetical protein KKA07_16475, partial [Bacteroidetes bacterium]|nr:hypothetical protein [Bacteroidota bacterium]